MVMIPANSSGTKTAVVKATYDDFGDLVTSKKKVIVSATDSFYMDAYEVTVGQFKKFLKASILLIGIKSMSIPPPKNIR